MTRTARSTGDSEWYADGLRFHCTQCGNCCTGPPGTVAFTPEEAEAMAAARGVDVETFHRLYTHRVDGILSLTERETEHGLDCIFLDRTTIPGKAVCGIYEARPAQCRTWPFWPENLRTPRAWKSSKLGTPCPGMDSGRLYPIEAIRIQRDTKV